MFSETRQIVRLFTNSLQQPLSTDHKHEVPVPAEENGDSKTAPSVTNEDDNAHLVSKMADEGDQALAKSANKTDTPAEVPESPTDVKTNPTSSQNEQVRTEPQEGKMEEMEDDGEHVEGDEDAVIY